MRESDTVWHRFTLDLRTNRYGPPDGNPLQAFTIPLVVTHRGGAGPEDYTALPATVTFGVGESTTFLRMRAIPDRTKETGEGLRLDFGQLPAGLSKSTWGPYETIEFVDEVLPELSAWFGAEAYTAREGGPAARVSIHLDEPVDVEPLEVRLRLGYAGGATDADHAPVRTVVPFAVGERTKTITVTAVDDTHNDDGESLSLSFVDDPNDRVATGNGPATVALEDNDGVLPVKVSFGAPTYTAIEGGSSAAVRVELDAEPGRAVTVPLTREHLGGTAPADYSGIPQNLAFAANQAAITLTVAATADPGGDGGESVRIGFGTLPRGVFAGRPETVVTLGDGSEQPFEVTFDGSYRDTRQVREGRHIRLRVLLGNRWAPAAGRPSRPVTIPLRVTRTGGATKEDHEELPESVTIAAGSGGVGFRVTAKPDRAVEAGEGLRFEFGPLPPGITRSKWGPYKTIEFVDPSAPASLSVSGPLLTLRYPGALDAGSTPSGGDFVVLAGTPGGAAAVPVTSVSVRGDAVSLALARPVTPDEVVTLTYLTAAMHPIRDARGLPAAPLADAPVRNETGASAAPAQAGTAVPVPLDVLLEAARGDAGTRRLDLSSRNLADVSALAGLTGLRELDLSGNRIADPGPLAGLTGLERLNLSGNRIADIGSLAGLTALRALDLSGNAIERAWPLARLTTLEHLDLSGNGIADIGSLSALTGLRVLDLSGNGITELWPLAGLTGLERLNLSDNHIGELWPLADLAGLEVLLLDRNRVADVRALSPLAGLANLGLSGNRVADIGVLARPGGLRRLDLSDNAVADISALGDASGLVWLRLPGNPVPDLAPLGRLEQLRWLWLDPATAAGTEALAPPAGRGAEQLWIELVPE